ncbi:hypothetical protein TRSC58_03746 [Trypanosoma rangeli SC58]|uniref:Secreted protein n=1 Tax=Trypanosoma rangeli SC58 TaxID=429131 RepID=A0A061J0V0_TRYRA|nr:hypothetical protein TRSC58_03746 [Trypanosoma rangeli SC58]
MRRLGQHAAALAGAAVAAAAVVECSSCVFFTPLRGKYVRQPSPQWDPLHEDINAHVKKRIPGETRVDRVRRFAREWRNVELELGVYKDSRGREIKYRKTFVYRYTYPNAFDEFWWPCK